MVQDFVHPRYGFKVVQHFVPQIKNVRLKIMTFRWFLQQKIVWPTLPADASPAPGSQAQKAKVTDHFQKGPARKSTPGTRL